MKIPFMNIVAPDIDYFNNLFNESVKANHYTNFGPNEKKLIEILESLTKHPVLCAANATLILDGLHHILSQRCNICYLPGFTFPATSLGCRIEHKFGETEITGELIGFATFESPIKDKTYSITTVPFGTNKPTNYIRPNTEFWIVDNAAGTSPDMEKAKEWIDIGADVVIFSLHATKILSGCEGGFAVFNNKFLYDNYKKYLNFGFFFENEEKQVDLIGSNHKMSELSAAYVLMYYDCLFEKEYRDRINIADKYKNFCEIKGIEYIYSAQAFWIKCKEESSKVEVKLKQFDIETKPYYRPLFGQKQIDKGSIELSEKGLCLPTWSMSEEQIKYVIKKLDLII